VSSKAVDTQHAQSARDVVLFVEDLRVALDPSGIDIDDEVTLAIHEGEVVGLVGESACGKTTVATSLLAQQRRGAKIVGGCITIEDIDVLSASPRSLKSIRGGLISYVPQDASASLNPALRIGTQLTEILQAHHFGTGRADREARLAEMMTDVSLPADGDFLRRYPHQLSGGQQQRVAIAMALACRPKVIVFDEPTTALDVTTQAHVLETIRALTRAYGVAALYVTHDLAVIANLADRIAVMYAGRVVEMGSRRDLFAGAYHPYTRRLLAAIPDLSGRHTLKGIRGWAPRPGQRVAGCAFTPRCDFALEHCSVEYPPVLGPNADHEVRCWNWEKVRADTNGGTAPMVESGAAARAGVETTAVRVCGVTAFYQQKETLHDVTISLHEHGCLALVGESGSGKTTLARCIAGLHPFKIDGAIKLYDKPLARYARERSRDERKAIQYIFQSPYSSLNPRKTVRMILARPLKVFFDLTNEEAEARMVRVLEQVALDASVLSRYPDQLSGGERQRIAIARALAAEPSVLICDEVTSWLDVSVQAAIIELLENLLRDLGVGMLFVTHNLALVRSIAQEVAVMNDGRIVEYAAVAAVLDTPQADYTKKLLADTPTI
jgi:peptide/nickel transport system ATP-binding protein